MWDLKACNFIKKYSLYALHASKWKGSPLYCPTACTHGAHNTVFSVASEQTVCVYATLWIFKALSLVSPFASCPWCGLLWTCAGTSVSLHFHIWVKHFCYKNYWGFVEFTVFSYSGKEDLIKNTTQNNTINTYKWNLWLVLSKDLVLRYQVGTKM